MDWEEFKKVGSIKGLTRKGIEELLDEARIQLKKEMDSKKCIKKPFV